MSTIYVLNKDGKPLMPTTRGLQFVGSNPTRHTIRPLRQVGPSHQPLKLESAVQVC